MGHFQKQTVSLPEGLDEKPTDSPHGVGLSAQPRGGQSSNGEGKEEEGEPGGSQVNPTMNWDAPDDIFHISSCSLDIFSSFFHEKQVLNPVFQSKKVQDSTSVWSWS